MTYADWIDPAKGDRAEHTWVLCEDGYFYYSSEVAPKTKTALMLNGVSYQDPSLASKAYYYAIDLQMEVVTRDDIDDMLNGGSVDAGSIGDVAIPPAGPEGEDVLLGIWPTPSEAIIGDPYRIITPERIVFDDVPFYKIARAEETLDGIPTGKTYALLVTQYVYDHGTQFSATLSDGNFWLSAQDPSDKSAIMTAMDAWWNARPALQAAVPAVRPHFGGTIDQSDPTQSTFGVEGLNDMSGVSIENANFHTPGFANAQSRPTANTIGATNANTMPLTGDGIVVFPLSGTEILRYVPDAITLADTVLAPQITTDTTLGRVAYDAFATTTACIWWARGRGQNPEAAGCVSSDGHAFFGFGNLNVAGTWGNPGGADVTGTPVALRPAFWIAE
jgi:hypothetical protein